MKKNFLFFFLVIVFAGCTNTANDFDRHPANIHYSKHAQCRMACRHIDKTEIKEILEKGDINFSKSDLNKDACHKRYALEGYSRDDQKLRIIAAECNGELTVITVIDLGKDWPCSCD
jgi:hypothetical protein